MSECDFEVKQDGLTVARGTGPHDAAVAEATHYAMMYGQDGPVSWTVHAVSRDGAGKRRRRQVLKGSLPADAWPEFTSLPDAIAEIERLRADLAGANAQVLRAASDLGRMRDEVERLRTEVAALRDDAERMTF